jgi:hypothetical protein
MLTCGAIRFAITSGSKEWKAARYPRGRRFGFAAIATWAILAQVGNASGKIQIQIRDLDQTVIGKPPPLLCGKSVAGERCARARKSSNLLLPTKVDEQSFRIVGEDEADPSRGTLSYVSPLARAVLTPGPGGTVEMTGNDAVILDVR